MKEEKKDEKKEDASRTRTEKEGEIEGAPARSAVPLWALVALGVGLRRVRQDGA